MAHAGWLAYREPTQECSTMLWQVEGLLTLMCYQIGTSFCVAPAQKDHDVAQCCAVQMLSGSVLKLAKFDCRCAWYRWGLCCWLAMQRTGFPPLALLG